MYANSIVRRWLPVATVVALLGWTGLTLAQEKKAEPPKAKDIVDVAKAADNLKTFAKLVETAGLVETLKGKGPFTVFAPTDDAFKKLGKELDDLQKPENKAKLVKILKNHVLDGKKTAADFKAMKTAKTQAGEEVAIAVKDNVVTVKDGKVSKADTDASNGVIHVVDAVLMPAPEKKP
jgi:uncharacterized surface protein with fasciclin (FAS1) repeats